MSLKAVQDTCIKFFLRNTGDEVVSADKLRVHARGPVWHRKQQAQGIIPKGLHGLDTDGTWSYSRSDGWVYGHGTFCWVACKTRLLGAFKWRRNSSNEAKRMWVETGKLKGSVRTVLMDSKADDQALFREFQRQRGIRLLTTARKGAAKSPGRQRMVKILNQRKNKQIDNQRRSTVEPRQGLLKEIFELERCWMRGNRNNRWVFAAMGVAVRLHHYRAWQARRSPWAIKQEVLGR